MQIVPTRPRPHCLLYRDCLSQVAECLDALLCRFRVNNFAIVDDVMSAAGAGVYPAGALLNHSCAPNCVLVYVHAGVPRHDWGGFPNEAHPNKTRRVRLRAPILLWTPNRIFPKVVY